jgi:hypothetical protein
MPITRFHDYTNKCAANSNNSRSTFREIPHDIGSSLGVEKQSVTFGSFVLLPLHSISSGQSHECHDFLAHPYSGNPRSRTEVPPLFDGVRHLEFTFARHLCTPYVSHMAVQFFSSSAGDWSCGSPHLSDRNLLNYDRLHRRLLRLLLRWMSMSRRGVGQIISTAYLRLYLYALGMLLLSGRRILGMLSERKILGR